MTSPLLPRHSLKSLLCFTNFLVATLALLMVSGGIILALDNITVANTAGIVKDVGKDFFASDITDSFEEFYSVFNKKGGWFNFAFVLTGIGAITFVVSIFGFCGVHKESHCLLITYILLLAIMILLQTAAALILNQRDQEMVQVVQMLGVGEDAALEVPIELALPSGGPLFPLHPWMLVLFLVSSSLAVLLLLLSTLLLITIRKTEDGFVTLHPV